MRHLLIILAILIMLPAFTQAQSVSTTAKEELAFAYDPEKFGWEPWGGFDNWKWMKKITFADVQFGGYIDTTLCDAVSAGAGSGSDSLTTTYYGKPIPLSRGDSLEAIQVGMYDSAKVIASYRPIAKAANQWYAGPWTVWDATGATSTTHNTLGAGNPDTLVTMLSAHPVIDWTITQYIQFKYVVISNKATLGDGSRRTIAAPTARYQPFLRGQVLITINRGDQ